MEIRTSLEKVKHLVNETLRVSTRVKLKRRVRLMDCHHLQRCTTSSHHQTRIASDPLRWSDVGHLYEANPQTRICLHLLVRGTR